MAFATRTTPRSCARSFAARASSSRRRRKRRRLAKQQGRNIDFCSAFARRVSVGDIAMMTRQLATLVTAGIPLVEAMSALTEQVEKHELKRALTQVRDRLNEGTALAKALEPHPKIFPNLYVNMVAAGEASGTLEQVLARLSDFMEGQTKLRGKVGAALAYPALMVVIGTVLISVMMVVVVPKVTSIFSSLDRALPWYTSLLINVSSAVGSNETLGIASMIVTITLGQEERSVPRRTRTRLRRARPRPSRRAVAFGLLVTLPAPSMVESVGAYAIGLFAGLLVALVLARLLNFIATRPAGKIRKDAFMLKLPIFGQLQAHARGVARFARTLATLLQSGVPLLKAMDIVKNVLDNAKLEEKVCSRKRRRRFGRDSRSPSPSAGAGTFRPS